MDSQIDINKVVETLMHEIGEQAKQIAMLKVQLVAASTPQESPEENKEDDD